MPDFELVSAYVPTGDQPQAIEALAAGVENGELSLTDMGSPHGTFVSPGSRLSDGQTIRLRPGEAFWLGGQAQTFVVAERRPG